MCGHAPLFVSILPLDHWHPASGYDRSNRIRQAALDRAFMSSGRVSDAIFDLFERLESKPCVAVTIEDGEVAEEPALRGVIAGRTPAASSR